MGDKHVLRAAVGGIAGELAERPLGLPDVRQDFPLDDDLGAGRNFEAANAAGGEPIGFAE